MDLVPCLGTCSLYPVFKNAYCICVQLAVWSNRFSVKGSNSVYLGMRLRFRGWDGGEYPPWRTEPHVPCASAFSSEFRALSLLLVLKIDNAGTMVTAPSAFRRPRPLPSSTYVERGESITPLIAMAMTSVMEQGDAMVTEHEGDVSDAYWVPSCRISVKQRFRLYRLLW